MKIKSYTYYIILFFITVSCKSESNELNDNIKITPISHATLVIEYKNEAIYVDPVGGQSAFENQIKPSLVLITDIHGEHLDNKTLLDLNINKISKVVPKAVEEKLDTRLKENIIVLNNGEHHVINESISVEAIPMYNLREEALKFHPKGRGNGYVLTLGDKRIYISGDTEDIVEMRALKNIDIAFICMNLPYTMPVEQAASAVLDFKPKTVYPYHYRGSEGKSDVRLFRSLIEKDSKDIEVVQLDWYK